MLYVLGSVVLGFVLPRFEFTYLTRSVHAISVSSAQAFLSGASSGMMALTGILFSIGFVIVQLPTAAYSPRLTSWFTRDPLLFHGLGMFIATFVYSLATLAWVDRDGNGYVPLYSTYIVLALLIVSMFILTQLVLRLGRLQITNVLRFVGDKGRAVIERTLPALDVDEAEASLDGSNVAMPVADTNSQTIFYRGEPQVVIFVDRKTLLRLAEGNGAVISLTVGIGDAVTEGIAIYRIYGSNTAIPEKTLLQALVLGIERSVNHDPKYAFRILVDIAIRALSPAVNDPTTAVQSIDQLEDLLSRLSTRRLDTGAVLDPSGALRVTYPCATWEDYLSLAFDEIRLFGASQIQVMRRLRAALNSLVARSGVRAEAVRRYLDKLDATLENSPLDADDRASARLEDRQGLGMSH